MLTCLRTCSKMLWTVPPRPWRSTTSRRTSLLTSRRSSTKSTIPRGTALWVGTSEATSPMRPSTLSTFTWGRWPSCSSSLADGSPPPRTKKRRLTVGSLHGLYIKVNVTEVNIL